MGAKPPMLQSSVGVGPSGRTWQMKMDAILFQFVELLHDLNNMLSSNAGRKWNAIPIVESAEARVSGIMLHLGRIWDWTRKRPERPEHNSLDSREVCRCLDRPLYVLTPAAWKCRSLSP